ncbi:MAG: YdiU family protein [Desulfocapsaceae bacterium]|nr:YdiU family protein [Desulfosporosinus sp.]MDR3629548.1 YdiU family protein [Desulfocapsaceae bacterium]
MTAHIPIYPGTLGRLRFDNRFVRELPADPLLENTRRQVRGACYSLVSPTKVPAPVLVISSPEAAALLDLSEEDCSSPAFLEVFAGNRIMSGMQPFAMCYGGHQFGSWAGQLGDGRAINLAEVVNSRGERWVLQLKGAGPTPYSRTADGLAVMRSSVREFLCSEAMFHLGIPTTRALSLIATGDAVERDMFYDGHPKDEPGAIVCRLSPSFIRFGNFEIFASRGETRLLQQLVDYTIRTDFPQFGGHGPEVFCPWFAEVCRRTAELMVHWMRVGFVHGVMNTDNMSILGLTIDYGPYGWLENFDPGWTPNTTDASGRRYCFGNQPHIAQWNLLQLANALYPIIGADGPLQDALRQYGQIFQQGWQAMIAEKLGFAAFEAGVDDELVSELFAMLQALEMDMTIFFRNLSGFESGPWEEIPSFLMDACYSPPSAESRSRLMAWLVRYGERLRRNALPDRRERMNRTNPKYVLRNYLAQLAIDKAEQGDYSQIRELLEVLRRPYDEQPEAERYAGRRPDWARSRAGCSMLSCSS